MMARSSTTKRPPIPSSANYTSTTPTTTISTRNGYSDDRSKWNAAAGSLRVPRANITVMTKDEQKAILKAYGAAFFRTLLLGHSLRQFMENLEIPPGVARFPDIHISFERPSSTTVEDNEGPDINVNTLGKPNK